MPRVCSELGLVELASPSFSRTLDRYQDRQLASYIPNLRTSHQVHCMQDMENLSHLWRPLAPVVCYPKHGASCAVDPPYNVP
jgi:hypothetical protein